MASSQTRPIWILPIIIFSQFVGTSFWFAGNAILGDLQRQWQLSGSLSWMISSVQLGFILGTLLFAFFAIADRYSPRMVFFLCCIGGSLANLGLLKANTYFAILSLRFITGICLAGIYPVGMKIAAGWYQEGLGKALGFLVGALVLGSSFPYFLKAYGHHISWQQLLIMISCMASLGGVLVLLFVPDGPYLPKGSQFNARALFTIFQNKKFRASAFGYFGHMWELYTFWTFIPVILELYTRQHNLSWNIPYIAFIVFAAGSLGCAVGGLVSLRIGGAPVAFGQLAFSGVCCLLLPWLIQLSAPLFLCAFILWGVAVVGDSPQFSALNAQTAPREYVASALTIVNCIGFSITIISIQWIDYLASFMELPYCFMLLAIGPALGLWSLKPILRAS